MNGPHIVIFHRTRGSAFNFLQQISCLSFRQIETSNFSFCRRLRLELALAVAPERENLNLLLLEHRPHI